MTSNTAAPQMDDAPKTEAQPELAAGGGTPPKPPELGYDPFTLSDGTPCRGMKFIKGKHLDLASRMAGHGASQMRFSMAMAAVTIEVGGRFLQLEDLDEMPGHIVMELTNHAMGKLAGSSAAGT